VRESGSPVWLVDDAVEHESVGGLDGMGVVVVEGPAEGPQPAAPEDRLFIGDTRVKHTQPSAFTFGVKLIGERLVHQTTSSWLPLLGGKVASGPTCNRAPHFLFPVRFLR
jgi:hypothetical protein